MKNADRIVGIIILIVSGFIMAESLRMPEQAVAGRTTFGPGVGFLPFWTGAIMAILSILLIIRGLRRPAEPEERMTIFPRGRALISVALLPVSLGAYIFVLDILGYVVSTFLFTLFVTRVVVLGAWKMTLVVAVVTTTSLYVIFQVILKAGLPANMFGF